LSGLAKPIGHAWRSLLVDGFIKGQFELARPDGTAREVEFSARANALPGMHIAGCENVTERRQLERDLWRAQRLESVGRLAGGVAQDFNLSPQFALRATAARTSTGKRSASHAVEIDHAADRAAALTAQLLAFGRRQVLQARPPSSTAWSRISRVCSPALSELRSSSSSSCTQESTPCASTSGRSSRCWSISL